MKTKQILLTLLMVFMVSLTVSAQSSLPFSENFNSVPVNQLPANWVLSSTQVGTVTAVVQKETPTSTNRLLLMGVTQLQNGNGALAVQIPENAIGKKLVKLTFKLMPTSANSGTFRVICTSTSFTGAMNIAEFNASDLTVGSWNNITVPVTLPSTRTITFSVMTTTANTGWAIDNVSVTDGYKPTNVTVSNITDESADLSWDAHDATNWEIRYKTELAETWNTVLVESNSYTLNELESDKGYHVQVRAKAAGANYYSTWSEEVAFTTLYRKFSADNGYGQTLYYNVIDEANHYVALTYPNSDYSLPWEGFTKPTGNLVLPQTVTNESVTYTVTEVGFRAFYSCNGLTGIVIPASVTKIDNLAFYNNHFSGHIVIPNSVTSVGAFAFQNSYNGTTEVTIGEGVTSLGSGAFDMYSLDAVHFNAINCAMMGTGVFSSYMRFLTIGSQVTNIPDKAFSVKYIQNAISIPASVQNIGAKAFAYCANLPSVYMEQGSNLVPIGDSAFMGCTSLASATLNANAIGIRAFKDCSSLVSLSFGENVASIGDEAFSGSTSLGSVIIPNSVSAIGEKAFYDSSVSAVTIGEGVSSVGSQAFWMCPSLTTVHFNAINCTSMKTDNYGTIDMYSVFSGGNDPVSNANLVLTTVTIGSQVTNIPEYAFKFHNITSAIVIPSSVQHIGKQAFSACWYIPSLTIADGSQLLSIGEKAFYFCRIMEGALNFPEGLTEIGNDAFSSCKLSSVNIPSSVTRIGAHAFSSCGANTGMVVNIAGNTSVGTTIVTGAFKESKTTELTLGKGVTSIGSDAFQGCSMLTGDLIVPSTVETIGSAAFKNCSNLSSVRFAEGTPLTSISADVFNNCSGLTGNLIIPNTITTIGDDAFSGCASLNGALVLGQGVSEIGEAAFKQCGFSDIIVESATRPTASSDAFDGVPSAIRVYVPYGQKSGYQSATGWMEMANYYEQYEYIANNGNWVRTDNWANGAVPTVSNVVCINADNALMNNAGQSVKFLYVRQGKTLNVTAKLIATLGVHTPSANSLVIKESSTLHGELVNPANYTLGTLQKNITGYGAESNMLGWYMIASPIQEGIAVNGLTIGDYDLYYYDEESHYWKNQKDSGNIFTKLFPNTGYLYANKIDTELALQGELEPCGDDVVNRPIYYTEEAGSLAGLNFIGNPFTCNAYLLDEDGEIIPFYRMNNAGNAIVGGQAGTAIKPGEGVFVFCPNDRTDHSVIITITNPGNVGETPSDLSILLPGHNLLENQDASVNVVTQTIALVEGWNWISTNVEITLDDLKEALVDALPGTEISIKSKDRSATYNGVRWRGTLNAMDVSKMYMVKTSAACEIALTGMPINPAEHAVTINYGVNWIGFPLNVNMSLADAFAGFAANGDMVKSKNISSSYNGTRWRGNLSTLEPGLGYIYKSTVSDDRVFTFPISAK